MTLTGNGNLTLQSVLNINALVWDTTTSFINIANPGVNYLNVSNSVTLDGTVNYFNLTGSSLSTTPSERMAFTTNTLTTNQFGIIGFSQGTYGLSISNNALYITLTALAAPSGGTTTVTNSGTYRAPRSAPTVCLISHSPPM